MFWGMLMAVTSANDCVSSDATLLHQRKVVCNSLAQSHTTWCGDDYQNVTASHDWPSQAVYMFELLSTLADSTTCLNTSYAADTTSWLNTLQGDPRETGNFMWTMAIFQPQYYDMPRKPGDRIEAPDTLGRKCWADAYLAQKWPSISTVLEERVSAAGLNISGFVVEFERTAPYAMNLCQEVLCNCFVNASYDPTRSGGCRVDVDKFHYLGFDREGLKHHGDVKYTWHEHCS